MSTQSSSIDKVFRPGGILDSNLPGYEFRPSQLMMASAVLEAIEDRTHLCVEAGTGTGKTLSYLVPALFSRKRAIISTATKNLQEQLLSKDIPFLIEYLWPELSVTCMKGRQNYLCLRRLDRERRQPGLDLGVGGINNRLTEWARKTETGDRAELKWLADDDPTWHLVDARSDACLGHKCELFDDCFVTKMRQRAFESDIVIVNHSLFFANLALESDEIGRILPDSPILILDEAHDVEDIASGHFGKTLSNFQLGDFCRSLKKAYRRNVEIVKLADRLDRHTDSFFSYLPASEGRYSLNLFKKNSGFVDLRLELGSEIDRLQETLRTVYHALEALEERADEHDALLRRLDRFLVDLEEIFNLENAENVYWFERSGKGVYVHLTPISIADLLREKLFSRADTVVLTSATMTVDGDFSFLRNRLGTPESNELVVPGEFDYSQQAALYIPRTLPEPKDAESYFPQMMDEIRSLLEITDGYAFLLFTSFSQMDRVYRVLVEEKRYPVLVQGEMPKGQLIEVFKSTDRSVLCATSSFWQGVDVRGSALRSVIIDKLPFHVPSEPLVAARLNRLQQQRRSPFLEYSVPTAVIALRQGLGRLIRSKNDVGIFAILDSRVWNKRYGELFLKSLPNCPVTDKIGNLKNLFGRSVSRYVEGQLDGP